ncbi:hypothetical protein dsat_2224 [Alkalidesulfovibrio alkalitolerans DSM 16529]|uniref:Uncharacterized protein n=2 Tax=Alkalidesulfovibrio alkalitolerans TaxID=293256 RepID=S7TDV0_9BACT|nr:hypothetical protein dsat_2224 [Alkalidesulfovibrio alkalitolerans DSM 16529]
MEYEARKHSTPFNRKAWTTPTFWTATPSLVKLWDSMGLMPEWYKRGAAAERIIHVRNPKTKRPLPQGRLGKDEQEHGRRIQKVNQLLWINPVTFDIAAIRQAPVAVQEAFDHLGRKELDRTRTTLFRSFSGDKQHGGRFFGHRLQDFPKALRRGEYVRFGGEPIAELDFKSFNVSLLYALKGLDIPPPSFDPYTWDGCPVERQTVKRLVNTALNCNTRHSTILATRSELQKTKRYSSLSGQNYSVYDNAADDTPYAVLEECLDKALSNLPNEVQEFFFTGFGTRAMWYESEIAFKVMDKMVSDGLPIIPIHDGFVCQERHKDQLWEHMKASSAEVLNGAVITVQIAA